MKTPIARKRESTAPGAPAPVDALRNDAAQHKQMRDAQFKSAFRDICRKYYPYDRKQPDPLHPDNEACQEALFCILRGFTKWEVLAETGPYSGAGNAVAWLELATQPFAISCAYQLETAPYGWIRPAGPVRAYGQWEPSLGEISGSLLRTNEGRKQLVALIKDLLEAWPMVPSGVDADDAAPGWNCSFAHHYLRKQQFPLFDRDTSIKIVCILLRDDNLRLALARLAHDVRRRDGFQRKKGWTRMGNALEEGFERITNISLCKELAGLASDLWDQWRPADRKERVRLAQEHINDSSLRLTPKSNGPYTFVHDATRDARCNLAKFREAQAQADLRQNTKP